MQQQQQQQQNYTYLPVREAFHALKQRVNLIGVIVEYGLPAKSRGTDWFCTLKIMDESYQGQGLLVNMFAESMEKLPNIKSAGDIICLSQVVMQSKNGDVNAVSYKRVSTFALFEGKSGQSFIPYQVSSNFSLRHPEKDLITSLRTWLLSFQLDSAGTSESIRPMREIKEGEKFDLVCKNLGVRQVSKDKWMFFLWDGTDAPPLSIRRKVNDEWENALPLQLEATVLPRDSLCNLPIMGTVLGVDVDQVTEKVPLNLPRQWVKFIDLICEERSGFWCGVWNSSTRVRILSDEDSIVAHRQREYDQRLAAKWGHMPISALPWPSDITETNHKHVPFTTLMSVLTFSEVTAKFKCVVRVMAICPFDVEDFRSSEGTHDYGLRLTLEDPTARIHAILCAKDGEEFFDGYPSTEILIRKRNKLLGILEVDGVEDLGAPRNPPWIQVCLKSYYLDKNNPWSSRQYKIFDTRLVA